MFTRLGFVLQGNALAVFNTNTNSTIGTKCTVIESFYLNGQTFWFRLQENELSSVLTQTVPLECTHQELSFEWSHL